MKPWEEYQQPAAKGPWDEYAPAPAPQEKVSALRGDGENFLAGIGKGFVGTGRGIKQLGALVGNTLGMVDDSTVDSVMADADEAKRLDAELMGTKAGFGGNVVGSIAATAPAFMFGAASAGTLNGMASTANAAGNTAMAAQLARAATVASKVSQAVNPATYKGAAAVGAGMGLIQPVASDESRTMNVAGGAVGGVVGQKVGDLAGRGVRAVADKFRQAVATIITRQSVDGARQAAQAAGIDWSSLSHQGKLNMVQFVDDAIRANGTVSPQEAARQALLSGLPKPIQGTKGQLSQDFYQQESESLLADIPMVGGKIRNMREGQRQLLVDNIDELAGRVGAPRLPSQKLGEVIRDDVSGKYGAAKAGVKALYKEADSVGGGNIVMTRDLADWFNANAGDEAADALLRRAVARKLVSVNPVNGAIEPQRAALRDIYELRKTAGIMAKDGGSKGYIAGQMKGVVDDVFSREGGQAYAPAIAARRQLAQDFTDNRGVGQLLAKSNSYRMDPLIPDEKVFDRIVGGSEKDLLNYLARNPNTKPLQAEVIGRIRDTVDDVNGKSVLKVNALEKTVEGIGRPKLTILLGKEQTAQIYSVLNAAKLLERRQPSIAGGSATATRLANLGQMLLRNVEKLPVIGGPSATIARGATAAAQSKAATTPLQSTLKSSLGMLDPAYTTPRNALMLLGAGGVPALVQPKGAQK